jgi:uncharacterized protein YbaR (Trm112 family)
MGAQDVSPTGLRQTCGYRCPHCDEWYPGEIAVEPGYRVEVAQVIVTEEGEPTGLIRGPAPVTTTLYILPHRCGWWADGLVTDEKPETGVIYACPTCQTWYPVAAQAATCCAV